MDDDERLVEADGHRVGDRRLRHVELGAIRPVERLEYFGRHRVHLRALSRSDLHTISQEQLPNSAFAEEAGNFADDFVEPGNGAQCVERGAIGWMLPRTR